MTRRQRAFRLAGAFACIAIALAACAEIGSSPEEPAQIELGPLPASAIVLNDYLRDIDGAIAPIRAIVRNVRGEILQNANVRYIYADQLRDTALAVDSVTGVVASLKPFGGTATSGRIAARVGTALQVIRNIDLVLRPDSVDRVGQDAISTLNPFLPDTGRIGRDGNTSSPLNVVVRHKEPPTTVSPVRSWQVKYVLMQPLNPTNDTTQSVFLVDLQHRAGDVAVTDVSGIASRRVRIRAATFPPAANATDSVVVHAIVRYKGVEVKGSPVRMVVQIVRK